MKTEVVLVEKGKRNEAYKLLQNNGIKTFSSIRLRLDVNTIAVVLMIEAALTFLFLSL